MKIDDILPKKRTAKDILPLLKRALSKGPCTPASLEAGLGCDSKTLTTALRLLEKETKVFSNGAFLSLEKPEFGYLPLKFLRHGEWIHIGLVSDTHLCCKEQRLDALHAQYDLFAAEGITTVLHAGNIVDGYIPRINGASVIVSGIDDQALYVVDNYPARKGITTHFITGDDHEGWWQKEGFNFGAYLQGLAEKSGRSDLRYLGHVEADVDVTTKHGIVRIKVQHPGGGCFTEGSEILTRDRGWVDFKDLTIADDVATMRKDTGFFEWQKPTAITNETYSGDVYRFKARTFDFTVTPNHGLWVRHDKAFKRSIQPKTMPQKGHGHADRNWRRIEAADLYTQYARQKWAIPTVSMGWSGTPVQYVDVPRLEPKNPGNSRNVAQMQHVGRQRIEHIVEMIGWYVTEGSANHKTVTITQCQNVNPANHARITNLVKAMGLRCCVTGRNKKDINIGCTELAKYLCDQCGVGAYHKFLPKWVKDLPSDMLRLLVEVMVAGDGHQDGESFHYVSYSKRLRDDMCEIAQKAGFGVASQDSRNVVHLRTVQNTPTINTRPERFRYSGRIYCATVPNGLIYVRSNGKAFWSHNSAYARSYTGQKQVESFAGGEKPQILVQGHYHVSNYMVDRNVHVINMPGFQDQTVFARKKRLRMEVGGAILSFTVTEAGSVGRLRVEYNLVFDRGFYKAYLRSDKRLVKGHLVLNRC